MNGAAQSLGYFLSRSAESLTSHVLQGQVTSTWKHSVLVLSPDLQKKAGPRVLVKFEYLSDVS